MCEIFTTTRQRWRITLSEISWASAINTPDFPYDYQPAEAEKTLRDKKLTLNMWVMNEEQVYNPAPIKMAELIKWDLAKAGVECQSAVSHTYIFNRTITQRHRRL